MLTVPARGPKSPGKMSGMETFNPLRDAVPLSEIKRVLVIKLRHHGDVLVSSPVFSAPLHEMTEANLDSLPRVGILQLPAEQRVTMVPGPTTEEKVAQHLASFGLAGGDFIHIHPASRWFFKYWPVEHKFVSTVQDELTAP